jgi:two-component system phosphate regulon sensor histidine kinase PhoR
MEKKVIWIVVALMAVALLGVIVIQTRWISWSIRLNEDKFNKEVYSALNHVEKSLAASETALDFLSPDFQNPLGSSENSKIGIYINKQRLEDSLYIQEELSKLLSKGKSRFNQNLTLLEGLQVNKLLQSRDLTDRVDINKLDFYLRRELQKRGIDISYHYGVFANENQSFIILNGNYVVEEQGEQYSRTPINRGLLNSEYKVDLFAAEDNIPGALYIDFPNRNRILFKNVWPTIVGSVIFTAIILFCFTYTILVIFQQKKLSAMKTDFINNMTHEFKTPIATIDLAADSITSPQIVSQSGKVTRFASIIKQENRRLLSQVEKVLQMALLDKKDFKLRFSEVNVHEVIVQAVEHINLQVEQKGGQVIAELGAAHPSIYADHTHISNIIHNLLDNANKYSLEKPLIKVATRNLNGAVEITVQDKGIGMTKEQKKHIFEKFYRVHIGNLHDVKGFGLGLSYVKAMVNAHQGSIEVQSELGQGSSFILTLPFNFKQENGDNGVT